jgi:hypothetical protein
LCYSGLHYGHHHTTYSRHTRHCQSRGPTRGQLAATSWESPNFANDQPDPRLPEYRALRIDTRAYACQAALNNRNRHTVVAKPGPASHAPAKENQTKKKNSNKARNQSDKIREISMQARKKIRQPPKKRVKPLPL